MKIADLGPIQIPAYGDIRCEADIDLIVESPLREACKILYRKRIGTNQSSANKQDIGNT